MAITVINWSQLIGLLPFQFMTGFVEASKAIGSMSQSSLPSDWLTKFSDPYAVLGIAVTADVRRVQKRYRNVAMLLHPDKYIDADEAIKDFASQMLARLVNPAYEKLKQEKGRAEHIAMLRFQVRRMSREAALAPKGKLARELLGYPASGVDVFYEQAIAQLAEAQYQNFEHFDSVTQQLGELNLVYLQLKMGEVFLGEKRTGLVAATEAKPIQFTPVTPETETVSENYAQRHYRRAHEYMKKGNWQQAVQELRDAIRIEADKSEYHALLGVAYLQQNLQGMATVYLRQALKLNPNDPLANKYADKLGIKPASAENATNGNDKSAKTGGFFGLFRSRK